MRMHIKRGLRVGARNDDRGGLLRFARNDGRRGSLAVEAAIMLPLFVVGILTLGYLTKATLVEENVMHSFVDETHYVAAHAASLPNLPAYKNDVMDRINLENNKVITDFRFEKLTYLPIINDEISAEISYAIPLRSPRIFKDEVLVNSEVLCRAFVGTTVRREILPFDEMEKDDDEVLVWVFPRAGERYHTEDCSYIKNDPKEMLLSGSIRNNYSPCSLCKPGGLSNGALVYCFTNSGRAYHAASCTIVERFVIEIDEKDAIKKGYTPCAKCGGKK